MNKILLQVFGLNEFLLSLSSIIFIILAIVICSRLIYQITKSFKISLFANILIAINPLILLWGTSIRWYSFWSLLVMIAYYLFIKLWSAQKRKLLLTLGLIITLTLSLYTNYQTISFLTGGLLTALILDIKNKNFNNLKKTAVVLSGIFILFIPYISVFIFHTQSFFDRKEIYHSFTGTSPFVAGSYFIFSIFFGNSIYPWQLIFIILFIVGLCALSISIITFYKTRKKNSLVNSDKTLTINHLNKIKTSNELLRSI